MYLHTKYMNEIPILFENSDILVLNKPAGLIVHPDMKTDEPSVVDFLCEHFPEIKGVGEPMTIDGKVIDRPGIVHRLDRDTSGALLIAKTQEAFLHLKAQFQAHTIQKEYHAFVWGEIKDSRVVDEPIGRNKNDFRRWHAGRGIRGDVREAKTLIEPVYSFANTDGEVFTFVKACPVTGRTHQIRVHLKFIQRPIVSDALYCSKPPALGFIRQALHARIVTFRDLSGQEVTVEAPYPPDFLSALADYPKL
jgi:23S rRNA pseudouridine1911/1915/1917 synthase